MIEIMEVSACNEMPVVHRLRDAIAAAWPDIAASQTDKITLIAGVRTLREVDILVAIDLAKERVMPSRRRRDGSHSKPETVMAAMIAIEVKQLDASRFTTIGNQIFPDYGGGAKRSVNSQVADCCIAVENHAKPYGVAKFFVHGVGWLTEVSESELQAVSPEIVGEGASWFDILDAAGQRSATLYGEKPLTYRNAIAIIAATFTNKRTLSPRDRSKSLALCNDVLLEELIGDLAGRAGKMQIRLMGRGGSGKTTALALLAKRLAQFEEARVLILTFHRVLRGDIEHLVDSLIDVSAVRARIRVETAATFFEAALAELGVEIAMNGEKIDYARFDETLATKSRTFDRDAEHGEGAYLKGVDPKRFGWDFVFVDEAQDWTDAERDTLRALYGAGNIVLADGLEQLVRRQTSCDWAIGLPRTHRYNRELGRSLRMTKNVAAFANAFALAVGLVDWKIEPFDKLPGGRIVIAVGGETSAPASAAAPASAFVSSPARAPASALADAIRAELAAAGANPIDALFCVAPPGVESDASGSRRARFAAELEAVGERVWDATKEHVRDDVPKDVDTWRIVQFDSCRGLEGWTTVTFGLDDLVATKHKHPNIAAHESDTPEHVVRRWLMIALTRAVHTLAITITNPEAPLVALLREATNRLPNGVVEWTTVPDLAATIGRAARQRVD